MRILYFLILISIFTSCDHPKEPYIEELTWPKRTVKLDNDLGVLTIRLPKEFDTSYSWIDETDSNCGNKKKYRYQRSKFPILQESGWFKDEADSLYFFTIEHDAFCEDNFILDTTWLRRHINKIKADDTLNLIKYRIIGAEKIGKLNFYIIGLENSHSFNLKDNIRTHKSAQLTALANIDKHIIEIEFDCACSNCDFFIPKMYKALKTVEIKSN